MARRAGSLGWLAGRAGWDGSPDRVVGRWAEWDEGQGGMAGRVGWRAGWGGGPGGRRAIDLWSKEFLN